MVVFAFKLEFIKFRYINILLFFVQKSNYEFVSLFGWNVTLLTALYGNCMLRKMIIKILEFVLESLCLSLIVLRNDHREFPGETENGPLFAPLK